MLLLQLGLFCSKSSALASSVFLPRYYISYNLVHSHENLIGHRSTMQVWTLRERTIARMFAGMSYVRKLLSGHVRRRMDDAYADKLDGKITEDFWQRRQADWQAEEARIMSQIASLKEPGFDERLIDGRGTPFGLIVKGRKMQNGRP